MPYINRNLNQRMRMALYILKRDYGGPIDIYKLVDSTTDVRTGQKSIDVTVVHVHRAVVLPNKIDRTAQQSIAIVAASKELAGGGTYDVGVREFIVDRRDVPSLPTLTSDDWIVFDDRKFQIKTVEEFEFRTGWIITTRELVGEIPSHTQNLNVLDPLAISDQPASTT